MFNRISQNSMNTPLNLPLLGETLSYFFINRTQVDSILTRLALRGGEDQPDRQGNC